MSTTAVRSRAAAAAGVVLLAAGAAHVLFSGLGMLYVLPASMVGAALESVLGSPLGRYTTVVTFGVPFLGLPLLGVLLWRRPWWVRWAFLGLLLYNIGLLLWAQSRGVDGLSGLVGPG